jgi:hypothetical protein
MTPLHAQARALASCGVPVFPCVPDTKRPLVDGAYQVASTDLSQVGAWWTEYPDANVAIYPDGAGWCVVDLDPGGEAAWVALLAEHGEHTPTYMVSTPREGTHLYFAGSLPSTVGGARSGLAPHVDTRGVGGYVLVPPSVVGGKPYRVLHDRDIVQCPGWIAPRLAAARQRARAAVETLDTNAAVARATSLLHFAVSRGDVAIRGTGADSRTYQLCAELLNLGVSRATAERLLLEIWYPHCQPNNKPDFIGRKLDNALAYAQNEPGAWGIEDAAVSFGRTNAFREAMAVTEPAKSRYRLWSAADFDAEPEPKWIIDGLLPEDAIVLWLGPSQSFKSFLLLDAFLGVATGSETFGHTPQPGRVLYGAIEDLRNVGRSRRRAWQVGRDKSDTQLDRFRASLVPFLGMPGDFDDWCHEIEAWVGKEQLRLLAIDTAGKVLGGLNENASENVRTFWKMCDTLRERFGCSVVCVHHTGKDAERGARGSSAWDGDFDTRISTKRPSMDTLAVEVRVVKHKNAAEGQRWTFHGRPIAGSLVFFPTTADEHAAVTEDGELFSPKKIGKALAMKKAHSRAAALTSAELWLALGGELGDEKAVMKLDRLAEGARLRAYCVKDDKSFWWFYQPEG